VHDRRIDGEIFVFGNAGGLYKSAMTWWDHKTVSIWSQPNGLALAGPLKNTVLTILPSQMTSWNNWKESHPETLAMTNDYSQLGFRRQTFNTGFVIGLVLADQAKAYYYDDILNETVFNDWIGDFPVLLWAADNDYRTYLRTVGGETLTFYWENEVLKDLETGSSWDISLGLATEGPHKNQALQPIPSLTSFDWAWRDFYPESVIYRP
jgi:hypothetical protein